MTLLFYHKYSEEIPKMIEEIDFEFINIIQTIVISIF